MSEYSYQDMVRMQEDAIRRVREMQQRAKLVAQNAQDSLSLPETERETPMPSSAAVQETDTGESELPQEPSRVRSIRMPLDLPANAPELSSVKPHNETPPLLEGKPTVSAPRRKPKPDIVSSIFGGIPGMDSDKALILSLCLLLYAQDADESLLLALLYLLT